MKCGVQNTTCMMRSGDYCLENLISDVPHCPNRILPTNADRIRSMSDEELAESRVIRIDGIAPCPLWVAMDDEKGTQYLSKGAAVKVELDYLRQPAKEGRP